MGCNIVLCPFWREWRAHFGVRVCDNLVEGVPSCVVDRFYPDSEVSGYDSIEDWLNCHPNNVVICPHLVRSDIWDNSVVKRGCFFGVGICIHNNVIGFGACDSCSRFAKSR